MCYVAGMKERQYCLKIYTSYLFTYKRVEVAERQTDKELGLLRLIPYLLNPRCDSIFRAPLLDTC